MRQISFKIGDTVEIGGGANTIIQTMCNTKTSDIEGSLAQCRSMYQAGSQMIRLTTPTLADVTALGEIRKRLRSEGIMVPIVADVHFSAKVAIAAASLVDKVRINPGNFSPNHEDACAKFADLIKVSKEHGTAIRIGLNHGSLGERITSLYGDTPQGMKEAVMEWLRLAIQHDFYNVVVSLKASNTKVMVDAYKLLYGAMQEIGVIFPLHLGVTEAGNGDEGRIKSAVGIGALLKEKIGDTIRVSLTENPVNEVYVAKMIVSAINHPQFAPIHSQSWDEFIISAACAYGPDLLDGKIDDVDLSGSTILGEPISNEKIEGFKENLLQGCRRRFTKPEYIACPGCGRTQYNLEKTFNEVKRRTSHLGGVKIAVMGCIVNGPGEMADADYGYVGAGDGKVTLYKGKTPVLHAIPQEEAIDKLLDLITPNTHPTL